jgi:hypothetical protein
MAVLARKRTLSQMEFYANAIRMRKAFTFLLLRDFGVKSKVRKLRFVTEGMEEADAQAFRDIAEKYGMASCIEDYPAWIIEKMRSSFWDLLHKMMVEITGAYTIWATNLSEAYARRNHMNEAISTCESLLKEMEYALDILPVDVEKYMPYVDMIEKEIALLKGWRKSDNKRIHGMKEKEKSQDIS